MLALIGFLLLLYFTPRLLTAAGPLSPSPSATRSTPEIGGFPAPIATIASPSPAVAGVPSVELCVGCHRVVTPNSPQVQQLMTYWNNKQPIPWVRVYRVPDFVYFSHQMHIAADVNCASCHGNVAAMERIAEAQPLTMGWCLGCHNAERGKHRLLDLP